jgi:hypothetical protein
VRRIPNRRHDRNVFLTMKDLVCGPKVIAGSAYLNAPEIAGV